MRSGRIIVGVLVMLGTALLAVGAVATLTGCSLPASPQTRFGFDPWSRTWTFSDTKDNDIEVRNLRVNRDTGEAEVESLVIRNNASDVRRANVEQIQAYTEQVRAVTSMFERFTAALEAIAPYAAPARSATIDTAWGAATYGSTPETRPAERGSPGP